MTTTESDRAAFLAAIRAAPEDDTPRLVFADWLEEHGQEDRAAFIRLQIDTERRFGPGGSGLGAAIRAVTPGSEYRRLRDQQRALLNGRGAAWAGPAVVALTGGNGLNWEWSRGFVESVTCPAADWLAHADAVLAEHPVRRVVLTTVPDVSEIDFVDGWGMALDHPQAPVVMFRDLFPGRAEAARHETVFALLARQWPGVAFELPGDPSPGPDDRGRRADAALLREALTLVGLPAAWADQMTAPRTGNTGNGPGAPKS